MTDKTNSPLRRRMIEDMTIRKFAPKTQASYIRAVRNVTVFLGRAPDPLRPRASRANRRRAAGQGHRKPPIPRPATSHTAAIDRISRPSTPDRGPQIPIA